MQSRQVKLINLVLLLCLAVFAFSTRSIAYYEDSLLKIYFFDVGQGDAIFIQTPNDNQVLIDGGPSNQVIQELGRVMPFYDHSIDLLVLTHPDADHINGLIEVLKRYKVGRILENVIELDTPAYAKWNELKQEAQITEAVFGQEIVLDDDIILRVLYPVDSSVQQSKTNNNSIVAKLVYGEVSLLLTGDVETKVERELVARKIDIDSDLLKVPHHGSKTSTTEKFIEAVTPEAAFIQVGSDNRYGHPHPTVLERLQDYGIRYYRTDINGTIELLLDGQNYQIELGE